MQLQTALVDTTFERNYCALQFIEPLRSVCKSVVIFAEWVYTSRETEPGSSSLADRVMAYTFTARECFVADDDDVSPASS